MNNFAVASFLSSLYYLIALFLITLRNLTVYFAGYFLIFGVLIQSVNNGNWLSKGNIKELKITGILILSTFIIQAITNIIIKQLNKNKAKLAKKYSLETSMTIKGLKRISLVISIVVFILILLNIPILVSD